jgi:hypothetical protein
MRSLNIATYPPRLSALVQMLETAEGQFDTIRICLNGYDAIPAILERYACFIPETDLKSAGKFHGLPTSEEGEEYFMGDDDMLLPAEYADRMAAHLIDADVVTAHGHTITATGQDWHDGHTVHCFNTATRAQYVHVGGDGCMVVRGGKRWADLPAIDRNSSDAYFALHCAQQNIPVLMMAHPAEWIKQQPDAGGTPLSTSTRKRPELTEIGDEILRLWEERDGLPHVVQKVCYTVITNGYDTLRQPTHVTPGWKYVVVTDAAEAMRASGAGAWTVKDALLDIQRFPHQSPQVAQSLQRCIKAMLHEAYGNLRSIYVDGNLTITGDLDVLAYRAKHRAGVITSKAHPSRDCAYAEAKAVIKMKRDTKERVNRVVAMLRAVGRPNNAGLSETDVLIRDHDGHVNGPISAAGRVWAQLMRTYSWRDQLTFDLVADLFGVSNRAPKEVFEPFIKWSAHYDGVPPRKADATVTQTTITPAPRTEGSTRPTLGIIAACPGDMTGLIPLFVMAALMHAPEDAQVTVLIPENERAPDMTPVLQQLGSHAILRYLIQPSALMNGMMCNPQAAHYLRMPQQSTDWLFCVPITHIILADPVAAYLPLMDDETPYVNTMGEYDTRLGPLHMARWDAMHPNRMLTAPGHDPYREPGHVLARLTEQMTGEPLTFAPELPPTGFDLDTRTGMTEAWETFKATDAFDLAVEGLAEEGREWVRKGDVLKEENL